jgi:hypothetical protein
MLNKFLFLCACLILSACGGNTQKQSGLTPFPDIKDPKDSALFEAIAIYVSKKDAPPNSTYDYARVDLNGDGMREGIVLFKLPHTYWCGWDGCGMMIFKANEGSFTPFSAINGVRGPIYVSRTGNQGWRDIIIRLSGTKLRDKNILMSFEGHGYPNSPMLAPTLTQPLSSLDTEIFFR